MTPRLGDPTHAPSALLSADPANHVDRIATLAGIPRASVCTIELSPGAEELYHAALEYAAAYQNAFSPENDPRPMWIAPNEMYLDYNSDYDDSETGVHELSKLMIDVRSDSIFHNLGLAPRPSPGLRPR
jgi:hypothetical protein